MKTTTPIFKFMVCIGIVGLFYTCRQSKLIFYSDKFPQTYSYMFEHPFQEYFIAVDKHTKINALLFKADSSNGVIFYLHGNGGSIESRGAIADIYLRNNYDFFILDYRGYGKSQGVISSEKQLYSDIQIVYDSIKKQYNENKIIITGCSIGTGFAAKLASTNKPKLLILEAPYYNMPDLVHQYVKILPLFFLRYKIKTNEFIPKVTCPIVIFHGNEDEVINVGSSYKLQKLLKPQDRLIILEGQKHKGITHNQMYLKELEKILGT